MIHSDLFERIGSDLYHQGYSIQPHALPSALCLALLKECQLASLKAAGVGRQSLYVQSKAIRQDSIAWIEADAGVAQRDWLGFASLFQQEMNRRLLLGLFSFESHFSVYEPGAFYAKHVDAFKGQANRVLSLVVYLNQKWEPASGGELVLYSDSDENREIARVIPNMGTLAVFLSEDFPHEVVSAQHTRYSIAGWYRVNASQHTSVDPPR